MLMMMMMMMTATYNNKVLMKEMVVKWSLAVLFSVMAMTTTTLSVLGSELLTDVGAGAGAGAGFQINNDHLLIVTVHMNITTKPECVSSTSRAPLLLVLVPVPVVPEYPYRTTFTSDGADDTTNVLLQRRFVITVDDCDSVQHSGDGTNTNDKVTRQASTQQRPPSESTHTTTSMDIVHDVSMGTDLHCRCNHKHDESKHDRDDYDTDTHNFNYSDNYNDSDNCSDSDSDDTSDNIDYTCVGKIHILLPIKRRNTNDNDYYLYDEGESFSASIPLLVTLWDDQDHRVISKQLVHVYEFVTTIAFNANYSAYAYNNDNDHIDHKYGNSNQNETSTLDASSTTTATATTGSLSDPRHHEYNDSDEFETHCSSHSTTCYYYYTIAIFMLIVYSVVYWCRRKKSIRCNDISVFSPMIHSDQSSPPRSMDQHKHDIKHDTVRNTMDEANKFVRRDSQLESVHSSRRSAADNDSESEQYRIDDETSSNGEDDNTDSYDVLPKPPILERSVTTRTDIRWLEILQDNYERSSNPFDDCRNDNSRIDTVSLETYYVAPIVCTTDPTSFDTPQSTHQQSAHVEQNMSTEYSEDSPIDVGVAVHVDDVKRVTTTAACKRPTIGTLPHQMECHEPVVVDFVIPVVENTANTSMAFPTSEGLAVHRGDVKEEATPAARNIVKPSDVPFNNHATVKRMTIDTVPQQKICNDLVVADTVIPVVATMVNMSMTFSPSECLTVRCDDVKEEITSIIPYDTRLYRHVEVTTFSSSEGLAVICDDMKGEATPAICNVTKPLDVTFNSHGMIKRPTIDAVPHHMICNDPVVADTVIPVVADMMAMTIVNAPSEGVAVHSDDAKEETVSVVQYDTLQDQQEGVAKPLNESVIRHVGTVKQPTNGTLPHKTICNDPAVANTTVLFENQRCRELMVHDDSIPATDVLTYTPCTDMSLYPVMHVVSTLNNPTKRLGDSYNRCIPEDHHNNLYSGTLLTMKPKCLKFIDRPRETSGSKRSRAIFETDTQGHDINDCVNATFSVMTEDAHRNMDSTVDVVSPLGGDGVREYTKSIPDRKISVNVDATNIDAYDGDLVVTKKLLSSNIGSSLLSLQSTKMTKSPIGRRNKKQAKVRGRTTVETSVSASTKTNTIYTTIERLETTNANYPDDFSYVSTLPPNSICSDISSGTTTEAAVLFISPSVLKARDLTMPQHAATLPPMQWMVPSTTMMSVDEQSVSGDVSMVQLAKRTSIPQDRKREVSPTPETPISNALLLAAEEVKENVWIYDESYIGPCIQNLNKKAPNSICSGISSGTTTEAVVPYIPQLLVKACDLTMPQHAATLPPMQWMVPSTTMMSVDEQSVSGDASMVQLAKRTSIPQDRKREVSPKPETPISNALLLAAEEVKENVWIYDESYIGPCIQNLNKKRDRSLPKSIRIKKKNGKRN